MTRLPVMEHFATIQGEGKYSGHAAYFIRLGGCDVGCTWCDVKESWDAHMHPSYTIEEIVSWVSDNIEIVVVTGGEPLLYSLDQLTTALHLAGKRTHIETSGSAPISGTWDWICLSPKKFKLPLPSLYAAADELKVIVYNTHDLKWAKQLENQVSSKAQLLLQAEWSKREAMYPLITTFILDHPHWQISVQTHKYMNIP